MCNRARFSRLCAPVIFAACLRSYAAAQASSQPTTDTAENTVNVRSDIPTNSYANQPVSKAEYILGANDRMSIHVFGADDIPDRPVEVGADGDITAPLVGHVHASGMSIQDLEADLTKRYATYFKDPEVTITVLEYRSQPVTVVGSVNTPGVIQLRRPTRLMEVISQAGGLRPDAGDKIVITRRSANSPSGDQQNPTAYNRQVINLKKIIDGQDPSLNVVVHSDDLISVPKAKMVYVVGEVGRPGGYVLDGHSSTITVLQALALAGGVNKTGKASQSRILHVEDGGKRSETQINVSRILASKAPDLSLHADDILFVPNSAAKNAGLRALQMAADVGTGMAIWRF